MTKDGTSEYEKNRRRFMKGMLATGFAGGMAGLAGCSGGGGGGGGSGGGSDDGGSSGGSDGGTETQQADLGSTGEVEGDTASARALNEAKKLAADAEKDTLQLLVPSGSEGNFDIVRDQWESETGISIEYNVVPLTEIYQKVMNAATTRSSEYDVMLPSPFGLPDFAESNIALNLTDRVGKYGPEITGENGVLEPLYLHGNMYKGQVYGFCTDGDVMNLHLRTPWLENEEYQADYESQFGQQLKPPETYDEFDQQIQFFGEMDDKYGAWIFMSPFYAKWPFLRRLLARGQLPFDDNMEPNVNTAEGVAVLEQLKKLKPYVHPDATSEGYTTQYADYAEGDIYAAFSWPSFSKFIMNPDNSKIADSSEWQLAKVPGREVDGTMIRPCSFTFSWSFVVNSYSKIPELAYLYSQWMYSPEVSEAAIPAQGGYFDPYRKNHLESETIGKIFAGDNFDQYLEDHAFNTRHTFPDITMRGGSEYLEALDTAVTSVLNDDRDPETQLANVESTWADVTEKYGRDSQLEQWDFLKSTYGPTLREGLGLPSPPEF
jgi:multiple sugar transport system substrate-binding protein